jgi:hypothetical protein
MSTFDSNNNNNNNVRVTSADRLIPLLGGWADGDEHMKELYHHVCGLIKEAKDIYGNDNERREKDLKKLALFIEKKSRGAYDGGLSELGYVDKQLLCEQIQQYYIDHPNALETHLSLTTMPIELKLMIVASLVDDPEDHRELVEALNKMALVSKDMKQASESYYTNNDRVGGQLRSKRDKTMHDFFVAIMNVGAHRFTFAGYSVLTAIPEDRYMCSIQVREFPILIRDYAAAMMPSMTVPETVSNDQIVRLFEVNFTNEIAAVLKDVLPVIEKNSISLERLNEIGHLQMQQNITVGSVLSDTATELYPEDPHYGLERSYRMKPAEYDFTTAKNINEENIWANNYKRFYGANRKDLVRIMREKPTDMISAMDATIHNKPRVMNQKSYVLTAPYLLAIFEHLCKIGTIDIWSNNTLVVFHPTYSLLKFVLNPEERVEVIPGHHVSYGDEDDGVGFESTDSKYVDVPLTESHHESNFDLFGLVTIDYVHFYPADYIPWSTSTEAHLGADSDYERALRLPILDYLLTRSYLTRSDGVLFSTQRSYPKLIVDDNMLGYVMRDGPIVSASENFLPLYRRGAWRKTLTGSKDIKLALKAHLAKLDITPANLYSDNVSNNNNNNK